MFAFAALVVVATFIPPLRRYFSQWRRHRLDVADPDHPEHRVCGPAASQSVSPLTGGSLRLGGCSSSGGSSCLSWHASFRSSMVVRAAIVGLVIMSAVLVILWRASRNSSSRQGKDLFAAIICFLLGGAVILFLGTWLVTQFGTTPDLPTASLHVLDKHARRRGLVAPTRCTRPSGSRS